MARARLLALLSLVALTAGGCANGACFCDFGRTAAAEPEVVEIAPPPVAAAPPLKIVLRGINFEFDSSKIRPEDAAILDEAVRVLSENADVNVRIAGHTDAIGTEEYNLGLSERRALAVFEYLSSNGISAARLKSAGHGESGPVADNGTSDGRAQNRRVELNIQE